jgi:hypothetical protein
MFLCQSSMVISVLFLGSNLVIKSVKKQFFFALWFKNFQAKNAG